MKDRIPGRPGRVKITLDDKTEIEGVLSLADDPEVEGSLYNKGNVLPDDTCALLELDEETAEPRDAFAHAALPEYALRVGDMLATARQDLPAWFLPCDGRYVSPYEYPRLDKVLEYAYDASLKMISEKVLTPNRPNSNYKISDSALSRRYVIMSRSDGSDPNLYDLQTGTSKEIRPLISGSANSFREYYSLSENEFVVIYNVKSGSSSYTYYALFFDANMTVHAQIELYSYGSGGSTYYDIFRAGNHLFWAYDYQSPVVPKHESHMITDDYQDVMIDKAIDSIAKAGEYLFFGHGTAIYRTKDFVNHEKFDIAKFGGSGAECVDLGHAALVGNCYTADGVHFYPLTEWPIRSICGFTRGKYSFIANTGEIYVYDFSKSPDPLGRCAIARISLRYAGPDGFSGVKIADSGVIDDDTRGYFFDPELFPAIPTIESTYIKAKRSDDS